MPSKTCKVPKTYIALKSSKVSLKKPIAKQGKLITMRCNSVTAAKKYATAVYKKSGRTLKKVYLYKKGKVMTFKITTRVSKKTGKMVFVAKRVKTVVLKKSKKSMKAKKHAKKAAMKAKKAAKKAAMKGASKASKVAAKKAAKKAAAKKAAAKKAAKKAKMAAKKDYKHVAKHAAKKAGKSSAKKASKKADKSSAKK